MPDQKQVTILMATYNGEAYLAMQLDSMIKQTYVNWKLVIRDDGSADGTLAIIEKYAALDSRISRITYGTLHGSACKNFSQLAEWAVKTGPGLNNEGRYLMFADQDDSWRADKIAVSVMEISQLEETGEKNLPALCYSSFQFINEQNEELPQRLVLPAQLDLRVLLNENHAWGCTMIMNEAALKMIVPIPAAAVNHDYWIALVVSALGRTKLISQDLILYRQHAQNVSGNVDNMSFAKRFGRYIGNLSGMLVPLTANLVTVQLFYTQYKDRLAPADQKMIAAFIHAYQSGSFKLIRTLFKYRIFKIGLAKNAVYFYTLFLLRKKVIAQLNNRPI